MQKDMSKTEEIDEFDEHVKKWEEISQTHGKTSTEAGEYYDQHILPRVKKEFIANNSPRQKYDGLILTVGGSPEPVILSICAIKSKKIGLICTEGRKKSIDRIVKETHLQASDLVSSGCEVDGSNTIEIYKAIMDFYAKWNEPKKIALGITGGTKVMSSAAAMAGAILGADIYYVHTETKNILNKPVPRSEYLRLLYNPYTVFGDFEAGKANQLFRRHDYAGAQGVFKELTEQISAPQKLIIYQASGLLCEVYDAWDNFNVQHASRKLDDLLGHLTQFRMSAELNDFHEAKSRLQKQKEALDCLSSFVNNNTKAEKLPCSVSDRFHFAFTLYHNALRRAEQGKYDLACLLLYRLLEWIGQCLLDKYNINTDDSKHNYSAAGELCKPKKTDKVILEHYIQKHKEEGEKRSYPERTSLPTGRIGLVDMYLLLHALNDDIVTDFPWGDFTQQIETRNKSIYIHGRRVRDNKAFQAFRKTVEGIFKKAQEIADINADAFNEQHKFIDPLS